MSDWSVTRTMPSDMRQWLDEQLAKCEVVKKAKKKEIAQKPKRPMTDNEHWMLQELSRCTFCVGSYNKRFVNNLSALPVGSDITEKQANNIHRLFYRYRRQHGHPISKPENY